MSRQNEDHLHQSLISASLPGDALVPGGVNYSTATHASSPSGETRTPEVVSGGMDRGWFLHSLRRRWLLALCMGTVVGTGTAALLWYVFPESSTAVALFQVSSDDPSVVFDGVGKDNRKFEILQKTQLALLKSHFVLQAAVRDPAISNLAALANEEDQVRWLTDRVSVVFPQESEILRISVAGDENPEDLRKIVDAVSTAYEKQVVYADTKKKTQTRDILAKILSKSQEKIRRKMEDYEDLAKELGAASEGTSMHSKLLLGEVSSSSRQLSQLRTKLINMNTEYEIGKKRLKDPEFMAQQYAQSAQGDPQTGMMQQQMMGIDMQLSELQTQARRNSPQAKRLARKRQLLQQQLAQHSQQMRSSAAAAQQGSPNSMLKQFESDYRIRAAAISSEMQHMQQGIERDKEELTSMGERSVELAIRQAELDQLKKIANEMGIRMESWDVEASAPARIVKIQAAQPTPGINTMQRYMIASVGGLSAFALTCLGIGYMEFRNRRLNGPKQMDEGLGIRVVGTLPSLSSRKVLDPNHPVVAQLTESIDGVRTLLMHDSTSKQRQVIMVTSAATLEGRTTVASQLAASLARAGRRTLLVDGDLRRPALHTLFDVPLEDGLCEVLRADAELADVVRPTHAENLWVMPAGYCDVDAIQALARETALEAIFTELRSDYDFVIIDAAPIIGLSDSLLFGQFCDGALLSVLRDHSEVPKIYQAAELLRGVGIRLLGAVVNGVSSRSDTRVTQLHLAPPRAERGELQAT